MIIAAIDTRSGLERLATEADAFRNRTGTHAVLNIGRELIRNMEQQKVAKNFYSPGYQTDGSVGLLLGCSVRPGPELENSSVELVE